MYKRAINTFLLFGLLICFSACSSSSKSSSSPESIGRYTFDFLEQINVLETSSLIEYFTNTKTIKKFLSETVTEDQRKHYLYTLTSDDQAEWPKYLYDIIYTLKQDGAKLGIEWNKVTYLDFISRFVESENIHKGELFFKYDDYVYSVHTTSVPIDKKIYLVDVSTLRKVSR